MREIYLDNSATTMVAPEVADRIREVMCVSYGNPSSMHSKGVEAERILREAKNRLASLLKCEEKNLLFTSGGTESDNLAIIGAAMASVRQGKHLITTRIEHPAVLQTMKYLEDQGFSVTYLGTDAYGRVSPEELREAITDQTTLVSVMHTNNEIGSVQPALELGAIIKECNPDTLFHVDAVQGFGKAWIYPKRMKIDLLSASSHKIHGPKGAGLLYVGDRVRILPISYGGGQQGGLRNGTENVPGIAGMALAAGLLYAHLEEDAEKLYDLKMRLIQGVKDLGGVRINGLLPAPEGALGGDGRTVTLGDAVFTIAGTAPHIVSISFTGVRSEVLLHALEEEGIYCSAGSACSTHKPAPSATLQAIGLPPGLIGSTLRFSLSVYTTEEDIDETIECLKVKLPMLQRYTRS